MNVAFVAVAAVMVLLHRKHVKAQGTRKHKMEGGGLGKRIAALIALFILIRGLVAFFITGGSPR